jgi:dUTP pyrophosphatase
MLRNDTDFDYYFAAGDKIAQMVIQKVELWAPEIVQTLDITDRGIGGFGSTGV